jgi:hypothetical protein
VGDVVEGSVMSVKPYGAFIEFGGTSGLLHISQISHDRITNVEKVLAEGDRIKSGVVGRQVGALWCLLLSGRSHSYSGTWQVALPRLAAWLLASTLPASHLLLPFLPPRRR